MNTNQIFSWLSEQNKSVPVYINQITFDKIKNWQYTNGSIQHESGKFFTIDGIRVKTNWGGVQQWEQPIINQPEIGYLGIIVKNINGILHFLMQAKIEPGNVNHVQISPTLQATKSNYNLVHNGRKPFYLDYFLQARPENILLDQLQSEQGARFLKKRNRNIILYVDEEIPVYDNFCWMTLAQIKDLMEHPNVVNMDTRTVISGISYGDGSADTLSFVDENKSNSKHFLHGIYSHLYLSYNAEKNAINSIDSIVSFLTKLKSTYELNIEKVDIKKLDKWVYTNESVMHVENKYFQVIPVEIEIGNREVVSWCQPMIKPMQEGLCAFLCKKINGILHFAVQAKLECGNHDIIEFAPTVQCLTGNYKNTSKGTLPFLEYVLKVKKDLIFYDSLQSEEGGRFYREQNRNLMVLADDTISDELPENFIWMTLNQMSVFLRFNNFFNIQARSLIAAIKFV
jgi:oxidase EvaA